MKNTNSHNPSLPLHNNVDDLFVWISQHPYFLTVPTNVLWIISDALQEADRIHEFDTRADKSPYIRHPIWLVESMIQKHPAKIDPRDIIVLILHDTIEDHPECWQDIFRTFGLSVFRDILILTKISRKIRREMLNWLMGNKNTNLSDPDMGAILQILSPVDPLNKYELFSGYSENLLGQDSILFKKALILYKREILDKYKNQDEAKDEYTSLGNYLYFNKKDARRKLQDMLHNMSDMAVMEIKQPGYIEKRRIKAYILGVKLKNFGMMDEYAHLEQAFQATGYSMLSDTQVSSKISRRRKKVISK